MMMTGRGSPRLNLLQSKIAQKKLSPKDKCRAFWNPGLEKDLVELLHEHNTREHRGQNGWSSETWNKIVKKFHEKNSYVSFTKSQIQEKEKELKREYRMLKEARKQSGVSWNEQRCTIEAEPAIWDNIIISFPKAKKFRTKGFPLFDALGELYDGQTAEGTYNFTSTESSQYPILTQVEIDPEISSVEVISSHNDQTSADGAREGMQRDEDMEPDVQENTAREREQTQPRMDSTPSRNRQEREPKRRRQIGDVAGIMERYIEMRTKQVEAEKTEPRTTDEFSIKNCINVLNTMNVTQEEQVKAF